MDMVTAGDLLNKKFSKAKMGGYRISEVDSFLVDAAELFSKQTREIAELKRKLDVGQQKLTEYEKEQDSLREALVSAQKLADSIVRDARGKADLTLRDAEIKAEKIIERGREDARSEQAALVELKQEVSGFRSRLLDMYREHLKLITSLPALAEEDAEPAADAETPDGDEAEAPAEEAPAAEEEDSRPAEEPTADAAPAAEAETTDPAANEAAAAEDPSYHVQLNVRYDEKTGEYVPTGSEGEETAGRE